MTDLVTKRQEFSELAKAVPVSHEERICTTQLSYLAEASEHRELEFEEVKKLEILVRTLLMIRGKVIDGSKKKSTPAMSADELLMIARGINE